MQIVEPDFTMKLSNENSGRFDLTFNKRVKKRDTGQFAIEPGDTLYGLTLSHCLNKIVHHRTAKKWGEENISLKDFLKEFQIQYRELVKLCKESLPEKFDTGE
jgi:hypothetical protein